MGKTNKNKSGEVVALNRAADEALLFITEGIPVVEVHPLSKAAKEGWEDSDGVAREDVERVLTGQSNYGFKVGEKVTDVDLDSDEAVALAPKFLPPTGAKFGRASNRASHWLYQTELWQTEDTAVVKTKDLGGKTLVELRIGGGGKAAHVVGPGSTHPSGEVVEWEPGCCVANRASVDGTELKRCFQQLSAACLLARHWPDGGRHDASLPLAGWLSRLGWDEDQTVAFVEAVAEAAGDEEIKDRLSAVRDTFRKAKTDKKTTGLPTLTKLFGNKELVAKVAEQLAPSTEVASNLLEQMNAEYCVVMDGAKTRALRFVAEEIGGSRREVSTFISESDFCSFYRNKFVLVGDKPVSVGKWWWGHPQRRTYEGLTFRPDLEPGGVVNGRLNLWQGFGVVAAPGDWSLMRAHVREVLAAGNTAADTYISNFMAWTVQHPERAAEAALVLKGGRGTGKGTLGNALRIIFGQHAVHISSPGHLAGHFNAHLRDCCFLFADEAFWPGDKKAEGNLKRLVTEATLAVEAKFKDIVMVTNMLHLVMAANDDWVVPAGEHERRFGVFSVSEHKRQDQSWFAPLYEQLRNGGYEAMLYDLLRAELGDWHPRDIPKTAALQDQQRHSLNPLDAWVVSLLEDGVLPGKPGDFRDADPNPRRAVSHHADRHGLLDRARERAGDKLRYVSEPVLTHHLKEALGCKSWRSNQQRGWEFPSLAECRAKWEQRFPGWPWPYPEQEDWQDRSPPEQDDGPDVPQSERRY